MHTHKKITRITALLLSAAMIFSLSACRKTETDEHREQREFDEYCDELFVEMLSDDLINIHFTVSDPEKYGITIDGYTMGDFDMDTISEGEQWFKDTLSKLKEFDSSLLTERQQLSLATLTAYFEKQDAYSGYAKLTNLFGPNSGVAANMTVNFIEFTFEDEEDVKMYLELVKDTKRYMGQILEFVRMQSEEGYFMPDFCADMNIDICNKYLEADNNPMIESFEEKISELDIPEDKKKEYITVNEQYVEEYFNAAYRDIVDTLTKLKGTGKNDKGLCWYENGKEYYTAIIKEKSSTDMEPDEIIELLNDEMDELIVDYGKLLDDDTDLLDQYYNLDFEMESAEEILKFLADKVSREFPEPYTKEFVVKYQSEATEIEGTLAYYLTARLDKLDYNSIKVNRSAFGDDFTSMYCTLAHEGFPGHLYYYTSVFGNEDIPDACKIVSFIGFTEGYAEYAADRSYVLGGCSEKLTELMVLDDMFGYILESRIDLGINYEGWDRDECAEYCADYGIDGETSDEIYEILISDPGLLIPYTVGHIKMRDLREKAETKLGDKFDAVEFHRLITDTGIVTFEIMEDELDKYIKETR
ncbi:MAG: DUF885 domain-containing protein [Butyrivibrio sp.]